MRWSFDLDADALSIYLTDGAAIDEIEMPDGVVVDLDADGKPVAIEVLSPRSGWDASAIVQRFGLDDDARDSLRHLQESVLMSATRRHSVGGAEAVGIEITSASNTAQLVSSAA